MQHRMKEFPMDRAGVEQLFRQAPVGRIATLGADGYPYAVPVHFVYLDQKLYFHGLSVGEKLDNIARYPKVCFEVDELLAIQAQDLSSPCEADAAYRSAVAIGEAVLVEDLEKKRQVLAALVEKYAPHCAQLEMTEQRVRGTGVVEITIGRLTGKYHD